MRRRLLAVLFGLGVVGGFGWELSRSCHHGAHRRAAFEDHVASVCVDAARRASPPAAAPAPVDAPLTARIHRCRAVSS
jgi:hypothetical protein